MNETTPVLSLYVRRPAVQLAARMRAFISQRGWQVLPRGAEHHPMEESYVVMPGPRGGFSGVWPSHPEMHPEELGLLLSRSLDATVLEVVLGGAGQLFAYRRLEAGEQVVAYAQVDGQVTEAEGRDDVVAAVTAGVDPVTALKDAGCPYAGVTCDALPVEGMRPRERPVVLRFLPAGGDGDAVLEVDPLLRCPSCSSPMVERHSSHGSFFGCVRFPQCRGRLSARDAEAQREAAFD